MKTFLAVLLFAGLAFAQTKQHSVTLTWVDDLNPAGTNYTVYRATGLCSGNPAYSKIASAVAVKTYQDLSVTPGNYCYYVTSVLGGVESAPSPTTQPQVPTFAPTSVSATVQ